MIEINLNWESSSFSDAKSPDVWLTELHHEYPKEGNAVDYSARIERLWKGLAEDKYVVKFVQCDGSDHPASKDTEYPSLEEACLAVQRVIEGNINMVTKRFIEVLEREVIAQKKSEELIAFLSTCQFPYKVLIQPTSPGNDAECGAWVVVDNKECNEGDDSLYASLMTCASAHKFNLNDVCFMNGSEEKFNEALDATIKMVDFQTNLSGLPCIDPSTVAEYVPAQDHVDAFNQTEAEKTPKEEVPATISDDS